MAKKPSEDGLSSEKLTNKAEAVRRALAQLGDRATPTEIQVFVKEHFEVEMTTKVISVYKSKMAKKESGAGGAMRGGRMAAEMSVAETISLRDLRTLMQLKERHGLSRLREMLEFVAC